jgi:hypothetical protein
MLTTANPFTTQMPGAAVPSAKKSKRERFRTTVFVVLAAHVVLLMILLMGCNTQPSAKALPGHIHRLSSRGSLLAAPDTGPQASSARGSGAFTHSKPSIG